MRTAHKRRTATWRTLGEFAGGSNVRRSHSVPFASRVGAEVLAAVLAWCLWLALSAPAAPAASEAVASDDAIELTAGRAVFWDGEFVENAFNPAADSCGLLGAGCFTYRLNVAEPGSRLQVAIDHPTAQDQFDIRLLDPSGRDVTGATQRQRGTSEAATSLPVFYSHELSAEDPAPGVWTLRVAPTNVSRSGFRLRAKLEKTLKEESAKRRRLLPNLQMVPPFELTFEVDPAQAGNGPSCRSDEQERYAEYFVFAGPPRCLRFSTGPINVGQGRWEVDLRPPPGQLEGTAWQHVYYSDGSYDEREAGTFRWHEAHSHYHHTAIGGFELLELDELTGALVHRSFGPKVGACTLDVLVAEWHSVRSDPPRALSEPFSGACSNPPVPGNPTGGVFGLSRGWGDIYPWHYEGTFVPFPADEGDGLYVVRVASDTAAGGFGTFAETNDSDNVAYAYVRVSGDDIEVLERGRGSSPWDPAKAVVQDNRSATPDCPPSATQTAC